MKYHYLLDTHVLSYFVRNLSPRLSQRIGQGILDGQLATSVICRAEMRYGQHLMAPQDKRQLAINRCLTSVPALDWTALAADTFGELRAHLRRTGRPIGEFDTLIAAHALAEGLTLVTHNTRHFEAVPGLKWEDWMA